jgi:hypothetical protein
MLVTSAFAAGTDFTVTVDSKLKACSAWVQLDPSALICETPHHCKAKMMFNLSPVFHKTLEDDLVDP